MTTDTKTQILDTAQRLTALKGFDAFSYRDIAAEVNIKTSSIHYYFPSKADLAIALVDRYAKTLGSVLAEITGRGIPGFDQLKAALQTVCRISGEEKSFCLCGMLSADIHTITDEAKIKLNHFFTTLETWIETALKTGLNDGSIHATIRPKSAAVEIAAAMEGAMLIARVKDNPHYLTDTFEIILSRLRA